MTGADDRRLAGEIMARTLDRRADGAVARLPTERQLASELGVSRTAVRHALAVLQADGRVSRQVGRGTFVVRTDGDGGPGPSGDAVAGADGRLAAVDDSGPADVMAVRRLLEPQAMTLVVAWATERDLAEMQRCLAGGDAAETYEEFEAWDLALHRSIMAGSHSPLLLRLYATLETARQGRLWGDLKRRADSRERRQQYQEEHRALVAALQARDSAGAVRAMQAHLRQVERNLLGR